MPTIIKTKYLKKNKKLSHKNKQLGGRGSCIKTALFDSSNDLVKLNINSPNREPWYFPNFSWPPRGNDGLMSQAFPTNPQQGPAPVGHKQNIQTCFIPVPRAPLPLQPVQPMEPYTLTEPGRPGAFEGPPPPRIPPKMPGPPGPGAYTLGLEGIPVLPENQRPAQPIEILKEVVNRGTFNRDLQPAIVTSETNDTTCVANPQIRNVDNNQSGGFKKIKSKKNKKKNKSRPSKTKSK